MTDYTFTPQWPHGDLEEVFDDVFFVTGTSKPEFGGVTWQFSRNMTVVREGASLSLINTVRLDEAGLAALEDATSHYLQSAANDPDLGSAVGVDYMMLAGNVACAWLLAKSAVAAQKHIDAGSSDDFYPHKIATARFFAERILPRSEGQRQMVQAGSAGVMAIGADVF